MFVTSIGSKFGQLYVVPVVLVQNLTTSRCHQNWFHIWTTCNAISIGSNFGHQVALLALVTNLTTRWRNLHQLQNCQPDGATCISSKFGHQMAATGIGCKFGHQMAPLALVTNLATRWRQQKWSPSLYRVYITCITCITYLTCITCKRSVRDTRDPQIGPQVYLGPIIKEKGNNWRTKIR